MRETSRRGWRYALAILAVIVAAGLVACGDDDGDDGGDSGGPTTVRVTNYPVVDLAPVHIAISKGYFEEEGINVKLVEAPFGPDGVAGLVGGSYEFALASIMDALSASGQGVPIRAIATGRTQVEGQDASAIVVSPDAGIETIADLDGKTIGRDAENSLPDMGLRALLQENGADPDGFKGVDLDFPDQVAALDAGQIDAGVTVEPFVQLAIQSGAKKLTDVFGIVLPDVSTTTWNVTDEYLSQNEDVVEGFVRALDRGAADAQADEKLVRDVTIEFTETPPPLANAMEIPILQTELSAENIQGAVDFALEWGGLTEPVDVEEYVAEVNR